MPCYWALVAPEDFDTALTYVFGEKGSEKRTQYAGLIEKITYYNDTVKVNTEEILKATKSAGTNMCIIAKYGVQMLPVVKDGDCAIITVSDAAYLSMDITEDEMKNLLLNAKLV